MKIVRSRYAGACYGVERALALVDEAAHGNVGSTQSGARIPVHTLGPLIHNPQVVSDLRSRGVNEVNDVDEVSEGILVIRSHGVAPWVIERAVQKRLQIVDATCPHVTKAQIAARELRERGCQVLIVGEFGHPEVEAIRAYAGDEAIVVQGPSDLPGVLPMKKVGIVVQTTQAQSSLKAVVDALQERGVAPMVFDTICFATRQRQEAAVELAQEADVMIVVGGRNSGNTTRLAQLCREVCGQTHHIETAAELEPGWFVGADVIGITAGASTPEDQIVAVEQALEALM